MPEQGGGTGPEGHLQALSHFQVDIVLAADESGKTFMAAPEQFSRLCDAHFQREQYIFSDNFTRMGWIMHTVHNVFLRTTKIIKACYKDSINIQEKH
jgi:hypothetical protein